MRHEYYHGEAFAMAGGTATHAQVTVNLGSELRRAFEGKPCRVFSSDLRVQLGEGTHYAYPDFSVVCGRAEFLTPAETTLLNPTLVAEVLSPSTAEYDRGAKFAAYRRLPSLREVVFVAYDRRALDLFRRGGDGRWALIEMEGGRLELETGGAVLSLDGVYAGVEPIALDPRPPDNLP